MELTWNCPRCQAPNALSSVDPAVELVCSECGESRTPSATAFDDKGLAACLVCSTPDLYSQKDFPQGLGLLIVIAGFAVGTVFWYYEMPLWTYGVFILSAALDLLLFKTVPEVIICYRCLSQYRGKAPVRSGGFPSFDLAVGERYRQERIRIEELKARASAVLKNESGV